MLDSKFKASIIIVSYNNFHDTTGLCMQSLMQDDSHLGYEVIIVDNASDNETQKCLNGFNKINNIKIIFNDENKGFAAANNIGLAAASSGIFILLNSDTVVPSGALKLLVGKLEDNPNWGAVGPMTNSVGNEQLLNCIGECPQDTFKEAKLWLANTIKLNIESTQLSFFCVAFSRDTWIQVGDLDERFGQGYYEDVDYCIRISSTGRSLIVAEDVFVYHRGGKSFSQVPLGVKSLMKKNRRQLLNKHKAIGRKNLIHLREANLKVIEQYLDITNKEDLKSLTYRYNKRVELALQQFPRSLLKKILYKKKLNQVFKRWESILN
jgi:GT2 family glycosyltransferase